MNIDSPGRSGKSASGARRFQSLRRCLSGTSCARPTGLALEDLRLICSCGTIKTYPKHSILINEGTESDGFYIILEGKVKVYVSDSEGREVILNIQGPGQYFGELSLIDEAPRSASVA